MNPDSIKYWLNQGPAMNLNATATTVESREDQTLYAAELAALAYDESEYEARHSVTRAEVLERATETFTQYDDKKFIEALRDGNRQSIALAWSAFNTVFEKLVSEKTAALLKEAK